MGGRPQPAVARSRGAGHRLRALGEHVRRRRLADHHGQVRLAPRRAVRAARRGAAAPAHRRDAQRGVPAASARDPGGAARARAGVLLRARPQARAARDGADRRRAARGGARPRRPRPGQADRGLPGGRVGPPDGGLRLHDQGLVAAGRGPSRESLRAADARPDGRAGRGARRRPRRALGRVRPVELRGRAVRRGGDRARARRARAEAASRRSGRARAKAPRHRFHSAGLRPLLRGSRPRGPRGGRARGHGEPRRRQLDEPRRLDQQGRDLVGGRPPRLVCRRHPDARPLARVDARPSHRAGDRRDQPGRAAERARRNLEPLRPAAAADRHDLRPVRRTSARALVLRHVRGRPVDPGRHAERRIARPRGRRSPVDRHALDRHRAAGLHGLGAGVRAGPRVDVAPRALASRPSRRRVGLLPALHPADRAEAGRRPGPRAGAGGRLSAAPRRARSRG